MPPLAVRVELFEVGQFIRVYLPVAVKVKEGDIPAGRMHHRDHLPAPATPRAGLVPDEARGVDLLHLALPAAPGTPLHALGPGRHVVRQLQPALASLRRPQGGILVLGIRALVVLDDRHGLNAPSPPRGRPGSRRSAARTLRPRSSPRPARRSRTRSGPPPRPPGRTPRGPRPRPQPVDGGPRRAWSPGSPPRSRSSPTGPHGPVGTAAPPSPRARRKPSDRSCSGPEATSSTTWAAPSVGPPVGVGTGPGFQGNRSPCTSFHQKLRHTPHMSCCAASRLRASAWHSWPHAGQGGPSAAAPTSGSTSTEPLHPFLGMEPGREPRDPVPGRDLLRANLLRDPEPGLPSLGRVERAALRLRCRGLRGSARHGASLVGGLRHGRLHQQRPLLRRPLRPILELELEVIDVGRACGQRPELSLRRSKLELAGAG